MEADRMANLMLTDAVVDPERQVILEERRSRIDNEPAALLGEAMSSDMFRHHPSRIPIIGWESEMRGLTTADALWFYKRNYAPHNAILENGRAMCRDRMRQAGKIWVIAG